ncbi:hypothetical protein [Methylosinus sp. PW1]|uniref:hypothetical protein n=1 Tax=Methylosinus sp. PW1 TaxID=107636 RepID=UPI0005691DD7|nr:hypothetical protein [Methylosinus sp. PW1]
MNSLRVGSSRKRDKSAQSPHLQPSAEALRGFVSLFDETLAIETGAIEPVPRHVAAPAQPAPQPVAAPAPAPEKPFFAAWEDFVESKTTLKEWKADMPNNTRSARNTFEALAFRHNVTTELKNTAGLNTAWVEEITGHASDERTSESTRYTKLIYLTNLKTAIDKVTIAADLSHLRYDGAKGVSAPGAREEIEMFRALAEQEMLEKEGRNKVTVKLKMKMKAKEKA